MAVTGVDPAEAGLENWRDTKPKVTQLAAKEGESRRSISTLQLEQKLELESYGPGQFNTLSNGRHGTEMSKT